MRLLRFGDRGPDVTALQQALNGKPSRLPPLKADGMFGARTRDRVMEFQRSSGLETDGIVGPGTQSALAKGKGPQPQPGMINPEIYQTMLFELVDALAATLPMRDRQSYIGPMRVQVRRHLGTDMAIGGGVRPKDTIGFAGVAPLVLITICVAALLVAWVLFRYAQASQNPRLRQRAPQWRRDAETLENSTPSQETANKAWEDNRKKAAEIHDAKTEDLKRCLDLNKLLDPSNPCARALAKVKQALDSLMDTIKRMPGGTTDGFKAKDLVIGIGRAVQNLFEALRDAADKCPNCDFLRP